MSRSAASAGSERINRVGRDGGFDVRLEPLAAHNIDGTIEQRRDVILERDILVDADPGGRIDFDHDVDIAVGPVVAAGTRAEQGGMADAARPQGGLVLPQPVYDVLPIFHVIPVYILYITTRLPRRKAKTCPSRCKHRKERGFCSFRQLRPSVEQCDCTRNCGKAALSAAALTR